MKRLVADDRGSDEAGTVSSGGDNNAVVGKKVVVIVPVMVVRQDTCVRYEAGKV